MKIVGEPDVVIPLALYSSVKSNTHDFVATSSKASRGSSWTNTDEVIRFAHIRWCQFGGPDTTDNGPIAIEGEPPSYSAYVPELPPFW